MDIEEEDDNGIRVIKMKTGEEWQVEEVAIPDSGCSVNIAGRKWIHHYIENLDEEDSKEVKGRKAIGTARGLYILCRG